MALRLYTNADILGETKFHDALNSAYRASDRQHLKHFLRFTWLLLWAVREPVMGAGDMYSAPENYVVYRGVGLDLGGDYAVGMEQTWHEFSSTSESEGVARGFIEVPALPHTLFEITLTTRRACRVWDFSQYPGEREVLLPTGSRFRVTAVRQSHNGTAETRIDLLELPPYEAILEYGEFIPGVHRIVSVSDCSVY